MNIKESIKSKGDKLKFPIIVEIEDVEYEVDGQLFNWFWEDSEISGEFECFIEKEKEDGFSCFKEDFPKEKMSFTNFFNDVHGYKPTRNNWLKRHLTDEQLVQLENELNEWVKDSREDFWED